MNSSPLIINEYPPNIDAIRKVLPISGHEIFAWAGTIYNPSGIELTDSLIAHETVHFVQQCGNPEAWWELFLKDPEFRIAQETEAHRAEYQHICKKTRSKQKRFECLHQITLRLSSPMYGGLLSYFEAVKAIKK